MAEKTAKVKQPEKIRQAEGGNMAEKPKLIQKPKPVVKKEDDHDKARQPSRIQRWWRETIGELRKVNWPTRQDAWRLTKIVLAVMISMGLVLGLLDWVFSRLIALLVS